MSPYFEGSINIRSFFTSSKIWLLHWYDTRLQILNIELQISMRWQRSLAFDLGIVQKTMDNSSLIEKICGYSVNSCRLGGAKVRH